eukprot:5526179-Pyramimonas_sp.AAC.1
MNARDLRVAHPRGRSPLGCKDGRIGPKESRGRPAHRASVRLGPRGGSRRATEGRGPPQGCPKGLASESCQGWAEEAGVQGVPLESAHLYYT